MRNILKQAIFLLLIVLHIAWTHVYAQRSTPVFVPEPYASTIQVDDLRKHLLVLTSDSLQGRETGEPGQKKAAQYLATQFETIGLQPAATDNGNPSYFQRFLLQKVTRKQAYVEINGKKYTHLENMLYLSNVLQGSVRRIEVLLPAPNKHVQGKLLAFSAESLSEWRKKAAIARKEGALGTVVFVKDKIFKQELSTYAPYLQSRYLLREETNKTSEELTIVLPASAFQHFFGTSISKQEKAKRNSTSITFEISTHNQDIMTENVVGYLEGHQKKEEILVITAHYDHLGIRGKDIYRGADDNGTGTSALLEIAEAFAIAKAQGQGPARSILFMAITGEEKGLLGSDYYTRHPLFPLSETIANLNVDMIGRIDPSHQDHPNYVYLIGSDKISTELHLISEEMNRRYTKLDLDYTFNDENDPNRFYYRSDHYNFAKNGIPVIFYFSGVHEDYHKPSDTLDKILFDKYLLITRLIFHTAWELGHRSERPHIDKK